MYDQLKNIRVTFARNAYDKVGRTVSLYGALELVRHPAALKAAVGWVRCASDDGERKRRKRALPAIAASCRCSPITKEGIVAMTGALVGDLDHLSGLREAELVRDAYRGDPHVLAAFVSPGGCGVKILFRVDPNRPHLESWHAARAYVLGKTGHQVDEDTKDPTRLTFLSWDPNAYLRP